MEFFDSNCFIGLPLARIPKPVRTADELIAAMDRSGIARALVWHVVQRDYSEVTGNRLLDEALSGHADRLVGCWGLMPEQTGEVPPARGLVAAMERGNVRALRVWPFPRKFILRREVFAPILDLASQRRIPLFVPITDGASWPVAYDLMRDFPKLTCVICNVGDWGPDRLFRPLLDSYPNVFFEMGEYTLDHGIESFVERYGAGRMLFGSGFPRLEHGGPMLAIRHAEISDKDKAAIAGGNLEKLLAWPAAKGKGEERK